MSDIYADSPILSVRLMTYNHSDLIEETLKSINDQITNFKFEVVIGDDFSTDENLKKIKSFQFKNKNLSVNILERKPDGNYAISRKRYGRIYNFIDIINNCRGKYIALLDGDDYWTDPLKLQKQVDFLETHPEYSLVCGGYKSVDTDTGKEEIAIRTFNDVPESAKGYDITIERFLNQWVTKTLTIMYRSNLFDYNTFKKYKYSRDVHLVYTLLRKGKGYYMKEVLGVYREHKGGVFSSLSYNYKLNLSYLVYSELYRKNKDDVHLRKKAIRCLHRNIK